MSNSIDVAPVQPVERPILCSPYVEPTAYWQYDRETGEAREVPGRRPAGYFYKTQRVGTRQRKLLLEEDFDELPLVNLLREDVRKWRESGYRGASNVTRELLAHWTRLDRARRLFFCQQEAVETIIYLAELRIPGKGRRTGFQKFSLDDADLQRLLAGERPSFAQHSEFIQTLLDRPFDESIRPLSRLGCKMATGSGKTVVMAMLIAWGFCNRGVNPASREFPRAALVCCPNLTVKERLQVLRPDVAGNYFDEFDIVPGKFRPLLNLGKVLVTNWHAFAPESEHKEGDRNFAVVNKGPETPETFARRVLGDLYDRMPIMVLNDEGHHCWRPAPLTEQESLSREEKQELDEEVQEATVWVAGLDSLNNALRAEPGISLCVDLSATPFYIKGSGYPEGRPFPWLVSDFGLVDAIESGIVKIPRLPVSDTTGRPEPKYFSLWQWINDRLQPGERLPGKAGRPKPEVVYREAEDALQQIAGQWVERFRYIQEGSPGQEKVPPALIVVCDNTAIAEVFYRNISGEQEEEIVDEATLVEALDEDADEDSETGESKGSRRSKPKKLTRTVYGQGRVFPEYFSNTPTEKRTIRIDSKLLAQAESEDPNANRKDAAEALRQIVSTVGKPGKPGEHVRCVVSVSMLTEGWDANNVTHILGVRAFDSQLLCEQVVGRGLRRMDYTPDPATGMLTEEYVDVYGIRFSVIPFRGRAIKQAEPVDKPKHHVRAMPERAHMEIRFPVVEGYAFALKKNSIRCDVEALEPLTIEPSHVPTATFVRATVGYAEGTPGQVVTPFGFEQQDREEFYANNHLQTIKFQLSQQILAGLLAHGNGHDSSRQRVLRLQSRHQLFPQVYKFVDEYIATKVEFGDADPCELGLEKYFTRVAERIRDAIEPDDSQGELPLLPVLNKYKPIGTTADVDFKTTRPCQATSKSHINQVVLDTKIWEQQAAFYLESLDLADVVEFYARNDRTALYIPYEYEGVPHNYLPDYLVRLTDGTTLVLEIKGFEDEKDRTKHAAARRWVSAVNNWGQLGRWEFHPCRKPSALPRDLRRVLEKIRAGRTDELPSMAAASLQDPCDEGLFARTVSANE